MCFKVLKRQIVEKFFSMTSNLDKNIRALKKNTVYEFNIFFEVVRGSIYEHCQTVPLPTTTLCLHASQICRCIKMSLPSLIIM